MSSPCAVCGLPGELVARNARGEPCPSCSIECSTFILVRPLNETRDECALSSWRWRQRRAEARGLPFDEACPFDEAERALIVRMSMLWRSRPDVARDIERRAGVTAIALWPSMFRGAA